MTKSVQRQLSESWKGAQEGSLHSHFDIGYDTIRFMWRRIRRLFPNILFSFLLCFLIRWLLSGVECKTILEAALGGIFEICFLRFFGFQLKYSNPIAWYVSAMLIGEAILYPLLQKKKHIFTCVYAPLITLIFLGCFSHDYGAIGSTYVWRGIVFVGLLRAIMGLAAGCVCAELGGFLEKLLFTRAGKQVLSLVEVVAFMCILFYMQIFDQGQGDFLVFILFFLILAIVLCQKSTIAIWFRGKKIFPFLGRISLAIYLNQGAVLLLAQNFYFGRTFGEEVAVYIILTGVFSVVSFPASEMISYVFKNIKKLMIE